MTSRDPKCRSRDPKIFAARPICIRARQTHGHTWLSLGNNTLRVRRSRDQWRHVMAVGARCRIFFWSAFCQQCNNYCLSACRLRTSRQLVSICWHLRYTYWWSVAWRQSSITDIFSANNADPITRDVLVIKK